MRLAEPLHVALGSVCLAPPRALPPPGPLDLIGDAWTRLSTDAVDVYPEGLAETLRTFEYIERHGNQRGYRRAAEVRRWLLRRSSGTVRSPQPTERRSRSPSACRSPR